MSKRRLNVLAVFPLAFLLAVTANATVYQYRVGDNGDASDGVSDFVGPGFDSTSVSTNIGTLTIEAKKTTGIIDFVNQNNLVIDLTRETYSPGDRVELSIGDLDPGFSGLLSLFLYAPEPTTATLAVVENILYLSAPDNTRPLAVSGSDGDESIKISSLQYGTGVVQIDGSDGHDVLDLTEVFKELGAILLRDPDTDTAGGVYLPGVGAPLLTYTGIEEVRIPAPSTHLLFALGLLGLGYHHREKLRAA
jgi:hypothetical protein